MQRELQPSRLRRSTVTPLVRPVPTTVNLALLGTEGAVEQVLVAERGGVTDAVDFVAELHDLVLRGSDEPCESDDAVLAD